MKLTNETALIASLLGNKAIEQIPRFAAVQNEIAKHVTYPIPFLPIQLNQTIEDIPQDYSDVELWMNDKKKDEANQFFPFSFRSSKEENWYLLPWEPLINISVSNTIAFRKVAKAGKNLIGTIKERWSTDDYQITITGAFYGPKQMGSPAETYPRQEMEKLRDYLLTPEAIEVKCEPLQILNINRIVITDVSFPFTKGENVQAYEIRAVSDFPYQLIYKRKKVTLDVGMPTGSFDPNKV